jgi:hypothetical protein
VLDDKGHANFSALQSRLDGESSAALGTRQYGDELFGSGAVNTLRGVADFVIRSQGLHAWDQAINRAFTTKAKAARLAMIAITHGDELRSR